MKPEISPDRPYWSLSAEELFAALMGYTLKLRAAPKIPILSELIPPT
jgi:peptidoglycan/LPS O-acetylase OafA/YrhL